MKLPTTSPKKNQILLFGILFLISALWLRLVSPTTSSPGSVQGTQNQDATYLVTEVIDGDTIVLETGHRVRYIGIDTPELSGANSGRCFAVEARAANKALVMDKTVRLERDISETDRYGRLLRYVYVEDELVNEMLVRDGFARAASFPPDIARQAQFQAAEQDARENQRGLWKACHSSPPTSGCVIKGNISASGERIYHLPGQRYYEQTSIEEEKGERYFCSEEEASESGWRKSKV